MGFSALRRNAASARRVFDPNRIALLPPVHWASAQISLKQTELERYVVRVIVGYILPREFHFHRVLSMKLGTKLDQALQINAKLP